MVLIHVKHGDESIYLTEFTVVTATDDVITTLISLYNSVQNMKTLAKGKQNAFILYLLKGPLGSSSKNMV